eukprot:3753570-Prymnesium_polylepis.1
MSFSLAGAGAWQGRRQRAAAIDDDSDVLLSETDPDEVPVEIDQGASRQHRRAQAKPAPEAPPEDIFIASEATYTAVKGIFTPSHAVKSRTGKLVLDALKQGRYLRYSGVDLNADLLELAGQLASVEGQTDLDREHFAEKLTESSCRSRCGQECTGSCRVRSYVVGPQGTNFFFGSRDTVLRAVSTESFLDVWIWDELEETSMRQMRRMLDSVLESATPGLAMRPTELKTVPGQ